MILALEIHPTFHVEGVATSEIFVISQELVNAWINPDRLAGLTFSSLDRIVSVIPVAPL